jgi:hypothetical protein
VDQLAAANTIAPADAKAIFMDFDEIQLSQAQVCRGAWARVTIDRCCHASRKNLWTGHADDGRCLGGAGEGALADAAKSFSRLPVLVLWGITTGIYGTVRK